MTNRPVQNSETACVILISFFNKNVSRAVWLSSSRVTRICCLISEKRIVRIQQNLVRSFVIDCFMGAHDGFTCTNKTKREKNWANLESNVVAINLTGKACSRFTV